jgi:precorrin-6Y C5,15-methyltransferase (decarboxylating)
MEKQMSRILIFAGTVDGREMAEYFSRQKIETHVCVATQYGESLIPKGEYISVMAKRLEVDEMMELVKRLQPSYIIDATHPYAALVSENIRKVSALTQVPYLRLLREKGEEDRDCIYVNTTKEAAEYLKETTGNVLLTTGSKELSIFTGVKDYKTRLFARVLSTADVALECSRIGFEGKNLICMQGPFTQELNCAMIKQLDAKYLVTKESGRAGGFAEKLEGARQAGAKVIVIGRPSEEEGYDAFTIKRKVLKHFGKHIPRKISIVGIGMGSEGTMTLEGRNACENADVLIGAKRMVEVCSDSQKPFFISYLVQDIITYIQEHPQYENIAILQSGDVGFYSGARSLIEGLTDGERLIDTEQFIDMEIKLFPGISSVVYFCSRLKTMWQDVKLLSLHGREGNILEHIQRNHKVFVLMGGAYTVQDLCRDLIQYQMTDVRIFVGENLSYENEKIISGTPSQLKDMSFASLSVVMIYNDGEVRDSCYRSINDEVFIRGKVPMTKSEVRTLSLAKLLLKEDAVIYDVGAGTGSVSMEMAKQSFRGMVYAIERKDEAVELIKENQKLLKVANLQVIHGLAPEALHSLPAPTHVFIGGSSGNLKEILKQVFLKNQEARVVLNAISLETVAEGLEVLKEFSVTDIDITCVNISKSKQVSNYHMMMGLNPVYMIAFTGKKKMEG